MQIKVWSTDTKLVLPLHQPFTQLLYRPHLKPIIAPSIGAWILILDSLQHQSTPSPSSLLTPRQDYPTAPDLDRRTADCINPSIHQFRKLLITINLGISAESCQGELRRSEPPAAKDGWRNHRRWYDYESTEIA